MLLGRMIFPRMGREGAIVGDSVDRASSALLRIRQSSKSCTQSCAGASIAWPPLKTSVRLWVRLPGAHNQHAVLAQGRKGAAKRYMMTGHPHWPKSPSATTGMSASG